MEEERDWFEMANNVLMYGKEPVDAQMAIAFALMALVERLDRIIVKDDDDDAFYLNLNELFKGGA